MDTRSSRRRWRPTRVEVETSPAEIKRFGRGRGITRLLTGDPVGMVALGDRVVVETRNAFGAAVSTADDLERFMRRDDRRLLSHFCTGPLEVPGVGRDASLVVSLERVAAGNALTCLSSSTGYLRGTFAGRQARLHEVDPRGFASCGGVLLRGAPSLGMIATLDDVDRSPGRCSENGGNLDLPLLREGSRIYLPVNYARAQVALGDLHFRQGAAEVSGMGLEADGEVEVVFGVAEKIPYPVIETPATLAIVGWGSNVSEAARSAVENTIDYLKRVPAFAAWSSADLYQLLGGFDLVVGNATGKVTTCALTLRKPSILDPVSRRSVIVGPRSQQPAGAPPTAPPPSETRRRSLPLSLVSIASPPPSRAEELTRTLSEGVTHFEDLPLFHRGHSRELRRLPGSPGALVSRLNPVVYSIVEKGPVPAPGSELLRARFNARFCEVLHSAGVRTSTLATLEHYVLMSEEDVARSVEVVFKTRFSGSPKHRYAGLPGVPTRSGQALAIGSRHRPYVRFDWRNAPPLHDEVLPEGLAREFIDVTAAAASALRAHEVLGGYLAEREFELVDGCFFMSRDGRVICGEVSPDNLTIAYTGKNPLLERRFRERDKDGVTERWRLLAEHVL